MIHQLLIFAVMLILCTIVAALTCAKKRKEKHATDHQETEVPNRDLVSVESSLPSEDEDFQGSEKLISVNETSQKHWKSTSLSPCAEPPTPCNRCGQSPKSFSTSATQKPSNSMTLSKREVQRNTDFKTSSPCGPNKTEVADAGKTEKTVSEKSSAVYLIYDSLFLSRYNRLFGFKKNIVKRKPVTGGVGDGDRNAVRSATSEDASFFRRLRDIYSDGSGSSTSTTPSHDRRRSKSVETRWRPPINDEDTVPKYRRDYQTLYIVEDDAMVRSDREQRLQ